MIIDEYAAKNKFEISSNRIDQNVLQDISDYLGVSFGPELKHYILSFGYVAFKSVEMFGINASQGIESDMARQTKYIHKYFPKTHGFVALEDQGEGNYYLVNSNDEMYRYIAETDELSSTGIKLFEYITQRHESVSRL